MADKTIELEYRTEVTESEFKNLVKKYRNEHRLVSQTERISYMSFFNQEEKQFDLRIRTTNGDSELVLKIGQLHSSDRIELSQDITKDQFIGFTRMFCHLSSENYIAERTTYNFETEEGIVISAVDAGSVFYIEYELLSDSDNQTEDEATLDSFMKEDNITPLNEEGFNSLNAKLDAVDWRFEGSEEDVAKLEGRLANY